MTDPLIQDAPDTEEAQAATKAAVFNAAERLFALHGFQNVSVRDITAEEIGRASCRERVS